MGLMEIKKMSSKVFAQFFLKMKTVEERIMKDSLALIKYIFGYFSSFIVRNKAVLPFSIENFHKYPSIFRVIVVDK